MMTGVADNQNDGAPFSTVEIVRPAWLPTNALIHLDYCDGRYWVWDQEYTAAEIHGGSFDAAAISPLGMQIDIDTTNRPDAAGALFTYLAWAIAGGCKIVSHSNRSDYTSLIGGWRPSGVGISISDNPSDTENFTVSLFRASAVLESISMGYDGWNTETDVRIETVSQTATPLLANSGTQEFRNKYATQFGLRSPAGFSPREGPLWRFDSVANDDTTPLEEYYDANPILQNSRFMHLFHLEEFDVFNDGTWHLKGITVFPPSFEESPLMFELVAHPTAAVEYGQESAYSMDPTATFADVLLQTTFDGDDGATSAFDQSTHVRTMTFHGNAQLDTSSFIFGTASLLLDGVGDAVTVPAGPWSFGTDEFCIEFFFTPPAGVPSSGTLLSCYDLWNNAQGWYLEYSWNGTQLTQLSFHIFWGGESELEIFPSSFTSPFRIIIERDASRRFRIWVNDEYVSSEIFHVKWNLLNAASARLAIGCHLGDASEFDILNPAQGHIDSLRITRGGTWYGISDDLDPLTEHYPEEIDPIITSGDTVSVDELSTLSHILIANEDVTFTVSGGADAAEFEIVTLTATTARLRWVSNGTQDFEAPADADTNNIYVVEVEAEDPSGNTDTQTISVTVLDLDEAAGNILTEDGDSLLYEDGSKIQRETS